MSGLGFFLGLGIGVVAVASSCTVRLPSNRLAFHRPLFALGLGATEVTTGDAKPESSESFEAEHMRELIWLFILWILCRLC